MTGAVALLGVTSGCLPTVTPSPPSRVAIGVPASETWGTFSNGAGTLVVQFNDFANAGGFGWSWSGDGGLTWNYCNESEARCGPGGVVRVPNFNGAIQFFSDPAIVSPRNFIPDVVASALTLRTATGRTDRIAAMLSHDGGRTFIDTVLVNDDQCSNGDQDQQAIAVDDTVSPPQYWVVWRHNGEIDVGGTWGACIRRLAVTAAHTNITTVGNAYVVANTFRRPHVGGLYVQAGDGWVTVVYSDNADVTSDCAIRPVNWYSVSSPTGGFTWGPSHLIASTASGGGCVGEPPQQVSQRAFGFVRDPTNGWYWVVLQVQPNRLFVRYSSDFGSTWNPAATLIVDGSPGFLYPTIAVDEDGRVAVAFSGVVGSAPSTMIRYFAVNAMGAAAPTAWLQPQAISDPFDIPAANVGVRALGDFDVMTSIGEPLATAAGTGTFLTAYASTDVSPTNIEVVASAVRVE